MYNGKVLMLDREKCPKDVEFLDKNKFGKLVRLLVLLKRNIFLALLPLYMSTACYRRLPQQRLSLTIMSLDVSGRPCEMVNCKLLFLRNRYLILILIYPSPLHLLN